MALVLNNRVRETTSTTGTGAVTFAGAVDGFQTFAAGIGNDNTTYYAISLNSANEWEVGLGTLNGDSSTLTRTTVLESSNSDSAVDFAAGSKEIFCTLPAEKAMYLDASGAGVGGLAAVVDDTTPQLGGNLDVNGNAIVSASDGAIAINANGTGTVTMTTNSVTGDVIPGKREGTDFTDSLLVGHSTTGTLDDAIQNTIVGIDAGDATTSADNNTFVGYTAGTLDTTGHSNTFIGSLCGITNNNTSYNTGVGVGALKFNVGHNNTAVGRQASVRNGSGTFNTSIGFEALEGVSSNDHSYNTAVGARSNELVTTGGYNVTVGYTAGDNLTTGSGNILLGTGDFAAVDSARTFKVVSYDGSSTTNHIISDSSGNMTFAGTANAAGGQLTTTGISLVMGF